MMAVPPVAQWKGLALVVDERVGADCYVITDARGSVIAGGNVRTGQQFLCKQRGEAARVYAPENLAQKLLLEADNVTGELVH